MYSNSPAAHCLPSGLSPSVQEFHLLNRPLAADGSRTITAGSELHRPRSALLLMSVQAQSATADRPPCERSPVGCLTGCGRAACRSRHRYSVIGRVPLSPSLRTEPR
ncbi:hypothetical protein GZL_07249 [Streptomyces sp. 769]|nr:hypothetical protein GZL_07249 [Streptomyces sp. 769]